jgi:radical SAM protein with 4Fe4S-binding SPASM domain
MIERREFEGSLYVELQMSGEPTMHPRLQSIINDLHDKAQVMVGTSTNGHLFSRRSAEYPYKTIAEIVCQLEYLTISMDSVNDELYHKMRYPAHFWQLEEQLDLLFHIVEARSLTGLHVPVIGLQLVRTDMFPESGNADEAQAFIEKKGWHHFAKITASDECFAEMADRDPYGGKFLNTDLCLQPFTAVNITQDGDVVSCGYVFSPDKEWVNHYGNLNDQTLREIWAGPRVAEMRRQHQEGKQTGNCAKCRHKNGEWVHHVFLRDLVRELRRK